MTYTSTDPRAALNTAPPASSAATAVALPTLIEFRSADARAVSGGRSWLVRAQNLVLDYTVLEVGATVAGLDEPDESIVFTVSDAAEATVASSGSTAVLRGRALAVLPPGPYSVTAHTPLHLVRLFTTTLADRAAAASNGAEYRERHPRVAAPEAWPAPPGGPTLRSYRLSDFPPEPGRFGTIFRSREFMVNFLPPAYGPRDPNALSPHSHDDFEQISLAVDGEYVHHIRTPWTARRTEWVDDVHWRTAAPSVAIIPPPTVHTSENVGPGTNVLIDIFSPPRSDFSARPGWVVNAADYPAPEGVETPAPTEASAR